MTSTTVILIFSLIVIFFIVATFINLYLKSSNFTWRMMRKSLKRKSLFRLWALVPTLIFVGLFAVLYQSALRSTASMVITLNYQEASKGQNANGTRYNMSEIISDEVLQRTIEKGALENVTVEELASCLSVMPTVQGDASDASRYHVSTAFLLTYEGNKQTKNLDAENIVGLIADAYKEFYIEKYVDDFDLLKVDIIPDTKFVDTDYLDIADWLSMKASLVSRYMTELQDKSGSFTSSAGDTFASINEKVKSLRQVQIDDDLRAYLLQNGISKDKDEYISRLSYDNRLSEFDLSRARASYDIRNQAIRMYSEEMTRIVLVPTWDENGEYYMGRTKVGIDALSVDAESYSKAASQHSNQIRKNSATINSLENATGVGDVSTADHLIQEISQEIMNLAAKGRTVGQEYSETRMNKCISSVLINHSMAKIAAVIITLSLLFFLALNMYVASFELSRAEADLNQRKRKGRGER